MIVHLSFFWGKPLGLGPFGNANGLAKPNGVSGIFRVVNESKLADWICQFGHDPNLYPFSTDCK